MTFPDLLSIKARILKEHGLSMKLSEHFSLAELTTSANGARVGLKNEPPPEILAELKRTAARMEAVRAILGKPIAVLSGYRSPAVNALVGGSKTSAHMKGFAVDFICPGFGTPYHVAKKLSEELEGFDQIIHEYREWVHVGFGPGQRAQLLSKFSGKPYQTGILA